MTDIVTITESHRPDYTRDRWDRPLIIPVDGGKPVPFTRSSTWSKKMKEMWAINQWEKRCLLAGQARTPSLIARTLAIPMSPKEWSPQDKAALDDIGEAAKVAARANESSEIGTALHRMTERLDLGEDLGALPEPYAADIAAYRQGMAIHGFTINPDYVECRLVCDELQIAGSCDRIIQRGGHAIEDLKTGQSVDFSGLDFAIQLAIYAHSVLYDVTTGQRTPIPDLSKNVGFVVHLPAGQGKFTLYEVDIAAGWEAALLCADIDRWRKRKDLLTVVPPLTIVQPAGDSPVSLEATASGNEPQAAPSDRRQERIDNLRERCHTIVALSDTAAEMLRMNLAIAGLDLKNPTLTPADITAAQMIVEACEREANAPFNDLVPIPSGRVPGIPQPAA